MWWQSQKKKIKKEPLLSSMSDCCISNIVCVHTCQYVPACVSCKVSLFTPSYIQIRAFQFNMCSMFQLQFQLSILWKYLSKRVLYDFSLKVALVSGLTLKKGTVLRGGMMKPTDSDYHETDNLEGNKHLSCIEHWNIYFSIVVLKCHVHILFFSVPAKNVGK